MHDLVIRGGTVVDGSGAPARAADVAVDGGVISAVGDDVGAGRRELDADGLLVTPGFVDVHTHYDAQATWDPFLTPSSWHGCTTVVMGSCGVGFAPARPDRREWLIGLMEGVEDIPGSALVEGIRWDWESFPEYLDALARAPRAIDLGTSVPHAAVRAYVMDERGAADEPATAADAAAMAAIVEEAVRAGALGFSTSRTPLHRAKDGRVVPGTSAGEAELTAIGDALAAAGGGVFHVAPDQVRLEDELPWMTSLARRLAGRGVTVSFNLNQTDERPQLWRRALAHLEAHADLPLVAQVAGRAIGLLMHLDGTAHPFAGYPTFQALPAAQRLALAATPEVRARVLADRAVPLGPFGDFITKSFGRMFLSHGGVDYEPRADESVAAAAARAGRRPEEVAWDHLAQGKFIYFPLFNWADGSLEPTRALHASDRTVMGLGDAGAHCGAICDGGMPTFMLTHWARDRARGRLPLERVVRRQTLETARLFGLHDRGLLAPGFKADLNLIDLDRLALLPPTLERDLPAGGRRLLQRASGYVASIVGGTVVLERDRPTGELPGALVRGRQPAPREALATR